MQVPTAVQEDFMHIQKMRLDAVLYRAHSTFLAKEEEKEEAEAKKYQFHIIRKGSIISPCRYIFF
jgi:hypothetical protein